MIIEWLNAERTIARVTRRRHWWSTRRVAAVLYRHERCAVDRDNWTPVKPGWLFGPETDSEKVRSDWWDGSAAIERTRREAIDPWQPVADEPIPQARLVSEAP